ncbi:uncharacterized protein EV154DRAFT_600713 [Mucor mucedo]|uniref:uncharacterized protein n=1 Tax=Mucor mucedo TaxID=29922 RepID=UPI002220CEE7|nr:uncharacterized protein EV154DRAFT_600713 [Mucor mucedo]KAI7893663.1 hypothetical protein EV154DRAFT_600713 [Mucor mucedo]
MKFNLAVVSIFFLTTAVKYTSSQAVVPKYAASCGYLAKKIYCLGGLSTIDVLTTEATMNVLDIANYNGSTSKELTSQWEMIVTDTTTVTLESRRNTQTMQYPDGKSMLISGGFSSTDVALKDQTLIFNGETRSWNRSENYVEYPYGSRQIYYAASVYVPGYGVGFFGGTEALGNNNHTIPYVYKGVTIPDMGFPGASFQFIGYSNLTFLDINRPEQPWSSFPNQKNLPDGFTSYQQPIFDPKTNIILFFGGAYLNTTTFDEKFYDLQNVMTFDMQNSQWGQQLLQGTPPTPRSGHSVTLLNPSQRHVLLYGGQGAGTTAAVSDYCFTLDLDTFQWTKHDLQAEPGVLLLRTEHSALTINNDTVFIVFGRDDTKNATLVPIMLNVTDPARITLLDKYIIPPDIVSNSTDSNPVKPSNTNSTETPDTPKPKLSSGATIGISVGCTAAGLIAIAALVLWIRKRNKAKKQMETMEVDWDAIDLNYADTPTVKPAEEFSSIPQEKPNVANNPPLKPQIPDFVDESPVVNKDHSIQKPDGS